MQKCLDNKETKDLVAEDLAGAKTAGITGTPSTVLITKEGDGELIRGAVQFEQLQAVIEKYL